MRALAQFDLVKPHYPKSDTRMSEFYASTAYVNSLAEAHPGFLWRETCDRQDVLDQLFGEGFLYTLSVWKSPAMLKDFLYKTPHNSFRLRGAEWFTPIPEPRIVMWWIEPDHKPDLYEASLHLNLLRSAGPTQKAFDLKTSDQFSDPLV